MSNRWQWATRQARRDMPRPLGGADPAAHLTSDPDYDGARPRPSQARMPATPSRLLDAGTNFVGAPAGRVLGTDDTVAEHNGADWGDRTAPPAQQHAAAHNIDAGDGVARLQRAPKGSPGVTRTSELREREPVLSGGSRAALVRGKNSLPENNPDGYRFGVRFYRWVDRRMYRPRIVHTARPAPVRTARGINASPPLENPNRATSPFSWNARARQRTISAPLQRRQPATVDYATLQDDPTPIMADAAQFVRL